MPYIEQSRRDALRPIVGAIYGTRLETAGEVNYVITQVLVQYLSKDRTSYAALNEVIGVLECAKLEVYRRLAAPYEDTKIEENGDVF